VEGERERFNLKQGERREGVFLYDKNERVFLGGFGTVSGKERH